MIPAILFAVLFAQVSADGLDVNRLADEIVKDTTLCPSEVAGPSDKHFRFRNVGETVWALELAGRHENAERVAEFGLSAVGASKGGDRPVGSLPLEVRVDGSQFMPRYIVDAHAVSAVLEAAWRHASAMDAKNGTAWVEKWWPQIYSAGEFVVNWTRGPRGEPYPAYEPACGRDAGGPFESPGAILGVICAQNLAQLAGKAVPETWQQRRDALEILVRTTDFSDATRAQRIPWGLSDLRGILPDDHPLWLAPVVLNSDQATVRGAANAPGDNPAQKLIASFIARSEAQAK